jgi:valine--pyruvate aminotransferase
MKLSSFGRKFSADCGILHLMEDLGNAVAGGDALMLGGGNPSHIPAIEARLRERMAAIVADKAAFGGLVGNYAPPQGVKAFLPDVAALLRRELGWPITERNIALTNGSQTAFFYLFNLLAGRFDDGTQRRILLPLTPEYIGYVDVGLGDAPLFQSYRPEIEHLDGPFFKYRVDFDRLTVADDIAAICVSRPTNPTGNVLTDDEVRRLHALAVAHDIPLILDNAYGRPFPGIIFTDAQPFWDEQVIFCLSLSKFGIPGARTGIIVAAEEVVRAISGLNAIMSLAPGNLGAYLAHELVQSGDITRLSREVIRPHYQAKVENAVAWLAQTMGDVPYYVHKPEGTFFLWLWFKGLPISSQELYERLKERGVLVVPGHYFFPGLSEPWDHQHECIRVNVAMDERDVRKGLREIADVVRPLLA